MKNLLYLVFFVNSVFGDDVTSVSVMEGHSVTLHTDLTELKTDDLLVWTFGTQNTRIAQMNKASNTSCTDVQCEGGDDERFRDRLMLDHHTGSLTITNITNTLSGLYQINIYRTQDLSKSFNLMVYGRLSVPVITTTSSQCSSSSSSSSSCVLLCSVMNVSHVTLSWYNGSDLHSSISVSDLNISIFLPLEVKYQDTNTYSCVLNNPITNHTTHLNINDLCHACSGLSSGVIGPIVIVSAIVLCAFVAVVLYCRAKSRQSKEDVISGEELKPLNDVHLKKEGVKKVEAVEGETLTLNSGETEIEPDEVVWWFGEAVNTTNTSTVIAKLNKQNKEVDDSVDERFKDKLQLDHQTGDLTITNITTTDSGLYKLHIGKTKIKSFIVIVHQEIKIVTVTEGESVTLPTEVTKLQRRDVILWMYEDTLLTELTRQCAKLHANGNGSFKDRLCVNSHTGDLTINNITTEHAGLYQLHIKSTKSSFKRFNVFVASLPVPRCKTL